MATVLSPVRADNDYVTWYLLSSHAKPPTTTSSTPTPTPTLLPLWCILNGRHHSLLQSSPPCSCYQCMLAIGRSRCMCSALWQEPLPLTS
jgi:hypothetical protein